MSEYVVSMDEMLGQVPQTVRVHTRHILQRVILLHSHVPFQCGSEMFPHHFRFIHIYKSSHIK